MNEEQYFLAAINKGEPNADLIYADWLEEQGRPEADEIKDPPVVIYTGRQTCSSWSEALFGCRVNSKSRSSSRCWSWSISTPFFSFSRYGSWLRSAVSSTSSSQFRSYSGSDSESHSG